MRQPLESPSEPAELMLRLRDMAADAFDVVFESSPVMMFAVDQDFRIAKLNHRWTEKMGFQGGEVLGRRPSEFDTEESRARLKSELHPYVREFGYARQVPVCHIKKDGRPLENFLDIQVCRTGSCYAFGAWYDREQPMQLDLASWTMRILVQLSRLQHEFELFWPAFDGYIPGPDRAGPTQLPLATIPALEEDTLGCTSLLSIDLEYHRVTIDDKPVTLTAREWALLRVLVKNAGRVIGSRQLLQEAWGPEYCNEFDYVRAYIRRLRKKLESDPKNPRHILLERGIGYRLVLQN